MSESVSLPGGVLRAVAAIVDAAAARAGNDHWRRMAARVRVAADQQATASTTEEETDHE